MTTLSFTLDIEPISLNNSHGFTRRGIRYRKPETKKFEKEVTRQLETNFSEELNEITQAFNPKLHSIVTTYFFYIPAKVFYTKEKMISSRSKDLSNCVKILEDTIFRYLKIDDKFVSDLDVRKRAALGSTYKTFVTISLVPLLGLDVLKFYNDTSDALYVGVV